MKDPYKILGVSPGVDEATLRKQYLERVRQFPPEKCPQQFAEIREACDLLRDPATRLQRQIFEPSAGDSLEDIIADLRSRVQATRIPTQTLLSLAEA